MSDPLSPAVDLIGLSPPASWFSDGCGGFTQPSRSLKSSLIKGGSQPMTGKETQAAARRRRGFV